MLIKEVNPGAISKDSGKVYSWSILGVLDNEKQVKIKDLLPFNLTKYIDQEVECLIAATFVKVINKVDESIKENIAAPILFGKYIDKYSISKKWEECEGYLPIENSSAIKTKKDIFLISSRDFIRQGISVNDGDDIIIKPADLELVAWLPIL